MIPDKVRELLNFKEDVIHTGGDFQFPGKSMVGTHNLYLTNYGRVIAHDTGGVFANESIRGSEKGLKVSFSQENLVSLTNDQFSTFTFDIKVQLEKLLEMMRVEGVRSRIILPSVIPFYIKFTNGAFEQVGINFSKSVATINQADGKTYIYFSRIEKAVIRDEYVLQLYGKFEKKTASGSISEIKTVEILLLDKRSLENILESINSHFSIFDLVDKNSKFYHAKVSGELCDTNFRNTPITLAVQANFNKNVLRVVDEDRKEVILTEDIKDQGIYIDFTNKEMFVLNKSGKCLAFIISDQFLDFIRKEVPSANHLFKDCGSLTGWIKGRKFRNQKVTVAEKDDTITLFHGQSVISELRKQDLSLCNDGKNILVKYEGELCTIKSNSDILLQHFRKISQDLLLNMGLDINGEPFEIEHTVESLVFRQSPDHNLRECLNTRIIELTVESQPIDGSSLVLMKIDTLDGDFRVFVHRDATVQLIKDTFRHSKYPLLQQVGTEQIFLSWSRYLNDFVLYHYFKDIYSLKTIVESIQEHSDSMDKNVQLVNGIYHSIKMLKKNLDSVSIKLPVLLDRHEREFFNTLGTDVHGSPFKVLQNGLLAISSQLKYHLSEVEKNLLSVSFAIVPQIDFHTLEDKQLATRLEKAFWMTVGSGGVLLLSAISMSVNSWLKRNESKERLRLQEENKKLQLEFYANQAFDSLEHLTKTIIPYLISETNNIIFQSIQMLRDSYLPYLDKEQVREKIFSDMCDFYTFKQLPSSDNLLVPRKEVIELMQGSFEQLINPETKLLEGDTHELKSL